mmetsp:Transcript_15537/g.30590  ORF Transcript_15537/g.30590 Transcript_15537/m.30590 type:complete len:178 (+) Transcript_15537:97-630(+)
MALALALPDNCTLDTYKPAYDNLERKIYSIAPKLRDVSIEYEAVRGIQLDYLVDYANEYVNTLQAHIGVAQDELMAHLKEKIQQAQGKIKYANSVENLKFAIKLSYEPGGMSSLGTAVFCVVNNKDGTVDCAHAFYGEKWIEQEGVKLVLGRWPDCEVQGFLMYRLLESLPARYLKA